MRCMKNLFSTCFIFALISIQSKNFADDWSGYPCSSIAWSGWCDLVSYIGSPTDKEGQESGTQGTFTTKCGNATSTASKAKNYSQAWIAGSDASPIQKAWGAACNGMSKNGAIQPSGGCYGSECPSTPAYMYSQQNFQVHHNSNGDCIVTCLPNNIGKTHFRNHKN